MLILCNFCKMFEFCLNNSIMGFVKSKISVHQQGFLPGRSAITNLFVTTQFISDRLDESSQVDVTYADFSKAFDWLNHNLLLQKFNFLNFSNELISLLTS